MKARPAALKETHPKQARCGRNWQGRLRVSLVWRNEPPQSVSNPARAGTNSGLGSVDAEHGEEAKE
jgi:hypothetical protein